MDDTRTVLLNTYKTAHRLMMLNVVLWFCSGLFELPGKYRLAIPLFGFVYSLTCQFYYYYRARRTVGGGQL